MADVHRPVIIVSGPPGAGKSTIAAGLARSFARAVHLHTDDFWRAMPDLDTTLRRGQQRPAGEALTDPTVLETMWEQFADLGELEPHVLDTSPLDPPTTLLRVADGIDDRRFLLRAST